MAAAAKFFSKKMPAKTKSKTKTQKVDLKMATGVFQCFETNMENFSDFTVIVGDFQFSCHKFVLGSCSGFFEALLRTDMREKSESSCIIQGISPQTFGLILDVVYKGENVLNKGNMLSLWHASNQLQIRFLTEACELFTKENITTQNYWEIYQNANILESQVVLSEVRKTMVKSYFDIVSSDSFMKLSLDDLLEILQNSQLETCADFAVSSILKWAYSPEKGKNNYPSEDEFTLVNSVGRLGKTSKKNYFQAKTVYPRENIDADVDFCLAVPQQPVPIPLPIRVPEIEQNPENVKYRRSVLDQLLRVVRLNELSNECLTMLMNNEIIIENKSAIMLVNQQASSRLEQRYDRNSYDPFNQQQMYGHVKNQTQKACKHCGKAKNAVVWN